VTLHALNHYLRDQQRAGRGSGRPDLLQALDGAEARDDLMHHLREVFDLELLAEAEARVRPQVSPRDWKIFLELRFGERTGPEVARELRMTAAAVLMAKSRVQARLQEEIRRLEGTED
jgi:RNA polymerase sigma-70 factor (ECF subfamily)